MELNLIPNVVNLEVDSNTNQLNLTTNETNLQLIPSVVELTTAPTEIVLAIRTGAVTNNFGSDTVNVTAAENLSGHRIVTVEGYYASKDTANDKFKVLGITTGAVTNGSEATVQISGYVTEAGWNFTVGNPVFLSTNGHLTQTVPTDGFRLIVGKPKTATTLFLELSEPITTA